MNKETKTVKVLNGKKTITQATTVREAVKLLMSDVYTEKVNLEDSKHRVSKQNRDLHILDTYICWLCSRVIRRLDKNINPEKIIEGLKVTDWIKYSYAGKIYSGDTLREIMFNPREDQLTLLAFQADYMERATNVVIDVMEG